MGLFERKPDPITDAEVSQIIVGYWGASDGGNVALEHAECELRKLDIPLTQLHVLRGGLPLGCEGTTGQKVTRIDRVLKRLEREAS